MKRFALQLILIILILSVAGSIFASSDLQVYQDPVPTLVPPTLVPVVDTGVQEIVATESAVARIQRDGIVRVGILYNARPFGFLDVRGNVAGFDADIVRSIAEAWDVEVEFVQVTRQMDSAVQLLQQGQIDILASSLVHRREWDALVEFSQPYYLGGQHLMVRADDPATSLGEMDGRRIGVVLATSSETAVSRWSARVGNGVTIETFLTLDQAYVALAEGRVDGVVDTQVRLEQVSALQPDTIRVLDEPVEIEPHAFAAQRQDVSMRNLLNRTLQYLTESGRLNEIFQVYFPGIQNDTVQPWLNVGEDAPNPSQYSTALTFPPEYVVPQLLNGRALRVAGIFGVTGDSDSPESERRWDTVHRAIFDEIARRWGVSVEYLSSTPENAVEMVASGRADIAVGVEPNWDVADRVDFTQRYLIRGMRMMVLVDDNTVNFSGLGGRVVVTANNDLRARDVAVANAETVNARIEILQVREQDLAFILLEERDADVAFGDILHLLPHVQQFPESLRITTSADRDGDTSWYTQSQAVFAVPQNDLDFRMLVEFTLQELIREGRLQELLLQFLPFEDIPRYYIFPGSSEYMGLSLGQ